MIYILYGQPGSGKTTLANYLKDHLVKKVIQSAVYSPKIPVIIDGDEFRKIFNSVDYSKKGRENNIQAANTVATYISKAESKDVIMSLVNPYKQLRDDLKQRNPETVEILLQSSRSTRKKYHVNDFEKGDPDYFLVTDEAEEKTFKKLLDLLQV